MASGAQSAITGHTWKCEMRIHMLAEASVAAPARDEAPLRKAESRLGTGHGERISAPTQYTEFRRASESPAEIVTIHYNSRSNLLAQGIIPRPRPQPPLANPFPGGFVADPGR